MNGIKRFVPRKIALVFTLSLCAFVALSPQNARASGLLIADGGFGGLLRITEHKVNVTINNGIAVTTVDQSFTNQENRIVEALYTFPVPAGASVANFSMWINGTEMVGEVLEKERAREIYDSYKQEKRDPGLLEQTDYKTFEMRIFPIAPNAEQRVRITYYQELDYDLDWAQYVYPLSTVTRPEADQQVQGTFSMSLDIRSLVPIVAMESPSHAGDFIFTEHDPTYHQATMEVKNARLDKDLVLAYHVERPQTGIDLITSREDGEDGYFCLSLSAGEELAEAVTGMDYLFLLDISGSMADESKLAMSVGAVDNFVKVLGAEDRVELMTFNVQPNALFGEFKAVSPETLAEARTFLAGQRARGGTVLNSAIQVAYNYAASSGERPMNLVILSDGLTEQQSQSELLRMGLEKPKNLRIFTIGIGNEVNRALLEQLAQQAGGLAATVSQADNFERQAQAFRRKLMRPAISDVRISFPGAETYDVTPEAMPDLFHGKPLRVYGRYKGAGTFPVTVQGAIDGQVFENTLNFEFPKENKNNPEIQRMWAWHIVESLQKQADVNGSRADVVDEIVRLGEAYSIATEYTSFLVLENNEEYKRWKIERRNALRVDKDRAAQARLRDNLRILQETALSKLGPGVASDTPANEPVQQVAKNTPAAHPAAPQNSSSNNLQFRLPTPQINPVRQSGGGGGAIDPVSGGIALALAGLAARKLRRKAE